MVGEEAPNHRESYPSRATASLPSTIQPLQRASGNAPPPLISFNMMHGRAHLSRRPPSLPHSRSRDVPLLLLAPLPRLIHRLLERLLLLLYVFLPFLLTVTVSLFFLFLLPCLFIAFSLLPQPPPLALSSFSEFCLSFPYFFVSSYDFSYLTLFQSLLL